ncbi:uncharacterized protein G2W53_042178 [Senna tora]|uniref:Uncharacterized protein n=1 Tax=Senna tora TaxID=362788 RepID=A0A834SGM2_9FABA|nr:uncharacterized protein G2W53_042178 [Senna tora]
MEPRIKMKEGIRPWSGHRPYNFFSPLEAMDHWKHLCNGGPNPSFCLLASSSFLL